MTLPSDRVDRHVMKLHSMEQRDARHGYDVDKITMSKLWYIKVGEMSS